MLGAYKASEVTARKLAEPQGWRSIMKTKKKGIG